MRSDAVVLTLVLLATAGGVAAAAWIAWLAFASWTADARVASSAVAAASMTIPFFVHLRMQNRSAADLCPSCGSPAPRVLAMAFCVSCGKDVDRDRDDA